MKRLLTALACAAVVFTAVYASASSISTSAVALGAGNGSVSSCDSDGVSLTYTTGHDATAGYKVTQATVSGIASACAGLSVRVTLTDASATGVVSGGPSTVPAGGGSVNVSFAGTVGITSISNAHVEIG